MEDVNFLENVALLEDLDLVEDINFVQKTWIDWKAGFGGRHGLVGRPRFFPGRCGLAGRS